MRPGFFPNNDEEWIAQISTVSISAIKCRRVLSRRRRAAQGREEEYTHSSSYHRSIARANSMHCNCYSVPRVARQGCVGYVRRKFHETFTHCSRVANQKANGITILRLMPFAVKQRRSCSVSGQQFAAHCWSREVREL